MEGQPTIENKDGSRDPWKEYFELTKNKLPRPLLIEAAGLVKEKGEALDLGSGALNDTNYLLSKGFRHVTAVDSAPLAAELVEKMPSEKISYMITTFDAFDFPKNTYDLVNAQFSLPFNSPETFDEVFHKIIDSLKGGGIFTGQFFGPNDGFNVEGNSKTFHTREEAEALLAGMNMIHFEEKEFDGELASKKTKHWHVIHFIVSKKLSPEEEYDLHGSQSDE